MTWSGIAVGPIAWFISVEANFALAPLACGGTGRLPLFIVSAVSLALTLIAGSLSMREWNAADSDDAGDVAPVSARYRAMALAGTGLSALSFLVILAQTIPNLLLKGCE